MATSLMKVEPTRNKGRKPGTTKGPTQKKQPQRGMGVAQLERLRLQERLKIMTDITQLDHHYLNIPFPNNDYHHFQYQTPTTHLPVIANPIRGVPVLHSGPGMGCSGRLCLDSGNFVAHKIGNGGFCAGGSGQVLLDPKMSGGSIVETSKELSSMPKVQHCEVCSKKKLFNGESITLINGGRNNHERIISPLKNCDFLGLSQETQTSFFGNGAGSTSKKGSVEVVAIHRNGNHQNGNGGMVMEYDFFPVGKSNDVIESGAEASPMASSSAYGHNKPFNSIDLALKL